MAVSQSQSESNSPPRMRPDSITLENLNEFIANGNDLLERLKHEILAALKQNDSQWEQRFAAAEGSSVKPDTTIGVIGVTGSGKSSMLNALLDEEVLVPTSCLQACTATVIEVAWNSSLEHRLIAEVHFADAEAWKIDISAALKDAAAFPAHLNDDTTEAGMAFKKITAVYPRVTKQNIKEVTIEDLMDAEHIKGLLSTTIQLNADDPKDMHDFLKMYVEGKEKVQASYFVNRHNVSSHMDSFEYWPMVSKVRIHLRAPILETGVIIADLPGVGDSNAARGTIAQRHLGKCANIWIVTAIGRAVDDKVARNLLGESFKRQLRRDGVMSRVAFVCSKADELVISELRDKLRLSPDFMESVNAIKQERIDVQNCRGSKENEFRSAKSEIESMVLRIKEIGFQKSAYIRLRKLAREGEVVYPVAPRRSKRNASKHNSSPKKQMKILDYDFSQPPTVSSNSYVEDNGMDSDGSYKDIETTSEIVEQDMTQPALTVAEIDLKLKVFRDEEHELGDKKRELREKVPEYKFDLEACVAKLQRLADKEWCTYFNGRNTYCQQSIRADFTNGIRDLEDEEAELADDDYDPEAAAEHADQVQLQQDLPVFCVSSQGFQKLRGRLEGEKITGKFTSYDQTGIPMLSRHCHDLGRSNLKEQYLKYAEGANNLVTSVRFWLTGPSDTALPVVSYTMQEATDDMLEDISALTKKALSEVNDIVLGKVVKIFEDGAKIAQDKALSIVQDWTDPNAAGLRYQTFRAVVRRGGAFAKRNRTLDFAEDLLKPLLTCIDGVWNSVFNERIPRRLSDLRRDIKQRIKAYADGLDQNAEFLAVSSETAKLYQLQVERFKTDLVRCVDAVAVAIKTAQQDTNRLFAGNIQKELRLICEVLDTDSGLGVFSRIKYGMRAGIEGIRDRIFEDSVHAVESKLLADLEDLTTTFVHSIDTTCKKSRTDCRRLFARKIRGGKSISPKHKAVIQGILDEAECFFEPQETSITGADPKVAVETFQS